MPRDNEIASIDHEIESLQCEIEEIWYQHAFYGRRENITDIERLKERIEGLHERRWKLSKEADDITKTSNS